MAAVTINLDRDLEARISKYADGIGVPVEDLVERALIFALTTVYPDNDLPDGPFDPNVDNELPEGEIPVDPDYGVEEGEGGHPSTGNPNLNPNPNVNVNPDLQRPDGTAGQELPEAPEPK
jgi:hypothetical protein